MTTETETITEEAEFTPDPGFSMRAESPEKIAELSQRLAQINASKRDVIAGAHSIRMHDAVQLTSGGEAHSVKTSIDFGGTAGHVQYGMTDIAHEQFSSKLGITRPYYRKMQNEAPDLLARNVNHWLGQDETRNFLVRAVDYGDHRGDVIRALLSDRYRVVDNHDIFFEALEIIKRVGAQIVRIDLTEERMYIRALHPEWRERIEHQRGAILDNPQIRKEGMFDGTGDGGQRDRAGGLAYDPVNAGVADFNPDSKQSNPALRAIGMNEDWIVPGVVISNSEVGRGGVKVESCVWRPYCTNVAVFGESFMKIHLGPRHEALGILSSETLHAASAELFGTIKDVVAATFNRDMFRDMVARMTAATGKVLVEPQSAVENVVNSYGLGDATKQRMLDELISGGDPTVFGLMQAITATARDIPNYNNGINLERVGGQFLEDADHLVRVRA